MQTDFVASTGQPVPGAASVRGPTVLQVLPSLAHGGGGVERGTIEVAAAIVEAGGRAVVASAGGPMVYELARVGAGHVILPLASKRPWTMWSNVRELERVIRELNVDIVHARSRAPAWSAYYAAKRTKRHFITTFHGTYGASNWLKRRYNSVMTMGERTIAISGFIAGHVRQVYGVPADHIRVISRGVDLARFSPSTVSAERVIALSTQWRLSDGSFVIMLPGRLTRWKGQSVLIDAMAKLGRSDIICLLVGSDQGRSAYRRELETKIQAHGLGGQVRLVDHCADMAAAYMLTDVVVSASTEPEGFGRVMAEAAALGRPVVATDHGGAREIVVAGETGWLVPPNDVEALAGALAHAIDLSGEARAQLSERAIQRVRTLFTKDVMCAKTLDVYDEVLAIDRRTGP